jgi:flagellar motor switch protein FliG
MSMLDRYRKPGGFLQLLALVETCATAKQEKFLELIRAEDAKWADSIKSKMLDINRINSWNDVAFAEVIGILQDLTVATALHGSSPDIRQRIYATLSQGRRRKIDDLYERSVPSASEIAGQQMKIVETVRRMAQDGVLRFERFDPQLCIDEKLEELLNRTGEPIQEAVITEFKIQYEPEHQPAAEPPKAAAPAATATTPSSSELVALKKKLADLNKENTALRSENTTLKSKLEQIKRIA